MNATNSHPQSQDHVLLFTPELGGGGAEKHMVRLANHLEGFRVSIAVLRGGGSYEEELAPGISVHDLGCRRMAEAVLPLRKLVRGLRPDLVCSFMDHANVATVLATRWMRGGPKIVVGMQNTLRRRDDAAKRPASALVRRALPPTYGRADAVVALSRGVRADLLSTAPRLEPRVHVVYNAGYDRAVECAAVAPLPDDAPGTSPAPIVACGRLTEQKGFIHLLRAFRRVLDERPAQLWIVGEGPLRGVLEAEIERLGLSDAVWLAGFQENPYRFMRAASVFVLSSLWEGFGNVVVEAMAVGAPVVSTDCPHGPGEIIESGRSGILVPPADDDRLAQAILRVLRDPEERDKLAAAGRARAAAFSAEASARGYSRLFRDLLDAR